MSTIVTRSKVYTDRVELPDGSTMRTADALDLGYVVEGSPAAIALAAQGARDAAADAILSLPEAAGRLGAALHLASTETAPSLAARILAGLPLDADAEAVAPAGSVTAPAPADPKAARRAEIAAMGAARRGARA